LFSAVAEWGKSDGPSLAPSRREGRRCDVVRRASAVELSANADRRRFAVFRNITCLYYYLRPDMLCSSCDQPGKIEEGVPRYLLSEKGSTHSLGRFPVPLNRCGAHNGMVPGGFPGRVRARLGRGFGAWGSRKIHFRFFSKRMSETSGSER
jgi:hypothetical protein